jgi:hypothetical protein
MRFTHFKFKNFKGIENQTSSETIKNLDKVVGFLKNKFELSSDKGIP